MKLLSLFSGIGAFEKALDYLQIKYDLVNYCEIDKYASKSYSLIHNVSEEMNLGDITKVDTTKLPNDIDLISYGFPCQDISLAGKQKGFFQENIMIALRHLEFTDEEIKNLYVYISNEKPTDSQLFDKLYDEYLLYEDDINTLLLLGLNKLTRSGLFFEALRIINVTKPKVAIAENVKYLTSKKFKTEFNIVLSSLEQVGYNNYWKVLNAKDYGIPQNRERVFIVSIRKDIDDGKFSFPKPYELELRLKDMLESEVDEKYYLSDAMIKYLVVSKNNWAGSQGKQIINKEIASTLNTGEGTRRCDSSNYICKELDIKGMDCIKRVYDPQGLSPSLTTMEGGNRQPKIVVAAAQRKRENGQHIEVSDREYANAITTVQKDSMVAIKEYSEHSLKKIKNNIVKGDIVGTITANAMQSINHDNCHLVVTKNGLAIPLYKDNKTLRETIEQNNLYENEPANLDLYDRSVREESQTLTDPKHNSQRLWDGLRIRKLTPKECWRLMGFEDEEIDKCVQVSNTQLYKQAGNSIVVDVLEEIFVELFKTGVLKDVR